ncbi:phospholipase A-2-activating protein-like [Trichogramma pretiosum]|uniref:phospholipase A-2-activating protein-like n=1 Tax=Trichogramma pretiosum TaxID=7493 RepID=UPI0006C9DE5F|nr:phospholipase A-2-activating protein-like [Trichogramma pretiosum]
MAKYTAAKSNYRLRCELLGHSGDVRALAVHGEGDGLVSTSRDKTAIYWRCVDGNFVAQAVMTGHSNFVSAVCITKPSSRHPRGLIVTGSNDHHICIYNIGDTEPFKKFKAHNDTISCLNASNFEDDAFISGSWDLTSRLWSLDNLKAPKTSYTGHVQAVWCAIDLGNGNVVTGAADKAIHVYTRSGQIVHKLQQHTDCVRDLTPINNNEFLSCSNDAIVKHWSAITGDCLGNFYGHSNYIYSISALPGGALAVSSGEDKTVRVWHNGEADQTIDLPARSVWVVRLLPNTDIVCGTSDGVVRVFTADSQRFADPESMQKFEEAVAKDQIISGAAQDKDLKAFDPSALHEPGKKDGDIKLIKEGSSVKAYSWSQRELKWNLVGDVLGKNNECGKKLHNGIEYDYVFSVDIQDGVPPLKLPYNKGQDPFVVAQKFLHDNQLEQQFLEQVANFIIKNSEEHTPVVSNPSQYYDPFTGGNRYIPQGSSQGTPGPDPFTGQNRYVPPSSQPAPQPTPTSSAASSLIPRKDYLKLEQANLKNILDKLKGFNSSDTVGSLNIPNDHLEFVVQLTTNNCKEVIDAGIVDKLMHLLSWPESVVFPVLDVARLAVLQKPVNDCLCTDNLIKAISQHLEKDAIEANQMLTFRLLANMFVHPQGEKLGLKYSGEIFKAIMHLPSLRGKHTQVAITSYLLNAAIALNRAHNSPAKEQYFTVLRTVSPLIEEKEAIFRALVALGTLLFDSASDASLIECVTTSPETLAFVTKAIESTESKVVDVARTILERIVG